MPLPISRRHVALGLPAAAFSIGAPLCRATALPSRRPSLVPPVAQITIGRFTVTALCDGYVDLPYAFFPGRTPEQVEAEAKAQYMARPSGVRLVFNQYLVEDGTVRILIDAGAAGSVGESGKLPEALASRRVQPDQIDAVIVTHMHQDHLGGLVMDGRCSFPNAEVYVDRRDVAHWTDPAKQAGAPDYLQASFRLSSEFVRLYPGLQATEGDHRITRGISIVDLSGHTPGHVGVRIEDGAESLVMASDMLFPVVHPGMGSDVSYFLEQDRPAANAMRARFFPQAAEEGMLVAATHMPFPGLGRIVSDRGRLCWFPAEWV